jgi:hypothetical protein
MNVKKVSNLMKLAKFVRTIFALLLIDYLFTPAILYVYRFPLNCNDVLLFCFLFNDLTVLYFNL